MLSSSPPSPFLPPPLPLPPLSLPPPLLCSRGVEVLENSIIIDNCSFPGTTKSFKVRNIRKNHGDPGHKVFLIMQGSRQGL